MATIVTRAGKGSPLTNQELDSNFSNLNTDKAELSGAVFTGAITTNSTIDGRDVATDGTKLDGVEASADVTDATNVTAAGALMDSELTAIASVKALNQGVATGDSPTFVDVTATSLDISGNIDVDGTTNLDVVDIDGAVDMASTLAVGGVVTANAGVVVDNITIDGNEIDVGSGDLTLDVAGNLLLNADGGGVYFKDGGTEIGLLANTGTNFVLMSRVADKDIIFKGKDGASTITALTLDMSAAGAATFNAGVTATTGQFSTSLNVDGTATMDGLTVNSADNAGVLIQSPNDSSTAFLKFGDATSADSGSISYDHYSDSLRLKTINTTRMILANNGDISFYDDSGTTAKFFWDASAESLGIGGAATDGTFQVKGTGIDTGITNVLIDASFADASNSTGLTIGHRTDETTAVIAPRTATGNLAFYNYNGGWSETMRLTNTGNVGIGRTPTAFSSRKSLDIGLGGKLWGLTSATETGLGNNFYFDGAYKRLTTNSASRHIQDGNGHTFDVAVSGSADSAISWNNALTIDNSGNVLVGKTAVDVGVVGQELRSSGYMAATRDGSTVGSYTRLNSDGTILEFRKDGTAVGGIGSRSGVVSYIVLDPRSGVKGAALIGGSVDANNGIINPGKADGDIADDAISLGGSSSRFKDLYLSGGVYLGGTGAANKLDDYEEGTWTPTNGNFTTWTSPTFDATYTKIGRLVTATFKQTGGTIAANAAGQTIFGLPFAPRLANVTSGIVSNTGLGELGFALPHTNGSFYFSRAVSSQTEATYSVTYETA